MILDAPRGTNTDALGRMIQQWSNRRSRNVLRSVYFDGKTALQDFGISIPPQMKTMDVVLGWPSKAVSVLASRSTFDGFVTVSDERDPFNIADILLANNSDSLIHQALVSSLIHAVSFVTVSPGDTSRGEPEVLILPKSAEFATGLWDSRTQSLSDGLSVSEVDPETGMPTQLVWYARDHVTTFQRSKTGNWTADTQSNPFGRVWMEPLVFRPELNRPFGHSRISRAVMALTDAGMRTLARSEAHAEFFASPQRYALGADEDMFGTNADRWNAVMSRLLAISKDEDGDLPKLGQFAQMSMQPHFDHLRTLASLFAGETNLPLSSLGIVHDNPSSAEAIYAAKEDLVIEATAANRVWGTSLRRAVITGVMMRDNLREVPEELATITAKWRNPATPSIVSASDALAKQIAAMPWIGESEVALETLGYDDATITRLLADKRRAGGSQVLETLRRSAEAVSGGDTGTTEE